MKYLLPAMLIAAFALPLPAPGQHRSRKPPPPPPVRPTRLYRERDYDCFPRHRYSLQQRMNIYPFSKAARIAIASFRTPETVLLPPDSILNEHYIYDYYSAVPDGKGSSNKSVLEELEVLNGAQLDSLTAILYNYDYRRYVDVGHPKQMSGCYAPHNAVLFYNEKNEIFAFIELCFTCGGMRESDDQVDTGVPCNGKHDLLKAFFKQHNIRIGITQIPMGRLLDPGLK